MKLKNNPYPTSFLESMNNQTKKRPEKLSDEERQVLNNIADGKGKIEGSIREYRKSVYYVITVKKTSDDEYSVEAKSGNGPLLRSAKAKGNFKYNPKTGEIIGRPQISNPWYNIVEIVMNLTFSTRDRLAEVS